MLSLFTGLGVAFFAFYFFYYDSAPTEVSLSKEVRLTEVVLSAMPKILERWKEGDREGFYGSKKWKCSSLPHSSSVTSEFFKCQPRYMECWAREEVGVSSNLSVQVGEKKYQVRLKKNEETGKYVQFITKAETQEPLAPSSGIYINVEVEGLGFWPMILADTCKETYLPERVYSYGARSEREFPSEEMMWDNFGRKIFVDKFLVSNADWEFWTKKLEDPKILVLPKIGTTVEEQEAFCASRGKRRLEAHIWDAATMTPSDINRAMPEFIIKPWLPWTRDRRGTFFEDALLNPYWKPKKADCALAFVHECLEKYTYQPMHTDNVAWSGVFHVLGGVPERFRNSIEPTLVEKLSSSHLPAMAREHQLGRRGEKNEASGFRCYREVYP
ncbi:MAG: hypothetical protein K2P81_06010 [Bacteriovoracaceae bacterium]|nr:hypothetical protein [Bacteriovoracaceae bacterium]